MRKTDKKIDNSIVAVLTDVCESALKDFVGFQWLTHVVNYSAFPESLKVICVFDTNDNLSHFIKNGSNHEMNTLVKGKLLDVGVKITPRAECVSYDTEEDCDNHHDGQWSHRLSRDL